MSIPTPIPVPPRRPAVRLRGRRGDLPVAAGVGRPAVHAQRAAGAAGGILRLEPQLDFIRRRAGDLPLWPGRSLRRRRDGTLRPAPGAHWRAEPDGRVQRGQRLYDRTLAPAAELGRVLGHQLGRGRHRAGRHGRESLVQRPSRTGDGPADRQRRDRHAGVPACPGRAGFLRRLDPRGLGRGRGRGGPGAAGLVAGAGPARAGRTGALRQRSRLAAGAGRAAHRHDRRHLRCTGPGRAHAHVLVPVRHVLHLRLHHQRPGRHAPDRALRRSWHAKCRPPACWR